MRKRLIILALFLLVWGGVACSLSQLGPERQARLTATPTRTLKPTFTATPTPTRTQPPSPTPTPSDTAIPTPRPTDTPAPTDTLPPTDTPPPTLAPTRTNTPRPSPTPTDTRKPTRRPTRKPTKVPTPKPTNTPAPPFIGTITRGATNCGGYQGVTGFVYHNSGAPYPGVAVGVWSDDWNGRVSVTEASGKFEISLTDLPPGTFQAAVVQLDTCTIQDERPIATTCEIISNVVGNVVVTDHCTGAGANQVTEIEFVGP